MRPSLHVRMLGGFHLARDGERVAAVNSPRLQSLLAYLLLHRDDPPTRPQLASAFWPESSEAQARTNLRREIHHLRRAFPESEWLLAGAGMGGSHTPRLEVTVHLDVAEFEQALGAARRAEEARDVEALRRALEQAVACYRGDLLPDCYDDWVADARDRLRGRYLRALERLVAVLQEVRDDAAAGGYAELLLRQDPLNEHACRELMRLLAVTDRRSDALRAYRDFAERLGRELAIEPEPATCDLYEQLRMAAPPRPRVVGDAAETPLVGRTAEWRVLLDAWRDVSREHGHLVLIAGEPGIGKSRLAAELRDWVARQGIATAAARSYAAEGEHVYAPVVEWLRTGALRQAVGGLNPVWLAELSRLVPELRIEHPKLSPSAPAGDATDRRRLSEALAHAFRAVAGPVLLLLDDLQWCDRGTVEWLRYLFNHDCPAGLLVVGTVRPHEVPPDHPLDALRLELRRTGQITEVLLGPLDRTETTALVSGMADRDVDDDLARWVYQETEGNPLFVVETVRAGLPDAPGDRPDGASDRSPLPPKVSAVIAARLAQLSPAGRDLAALAATVGRSVSLDVLVAASRDDEDTVVAALDELCARHILRELGEGAYDFSHDKLRDVAYVETSAARRQLLHRRVARALETVHARSLDAVSAQLAAHCRQGGLPEEAVQYYEAAGRWALGLCAYQDGIAHIRQGLQLLRSLPETEACTRTEARLQTALGVALIATRGWPRDEVGEAYSRARVLFQRVGDSEELSRTFWGLFGHSTVRGDLASARAVGDQALSLAAGRSSHGLLLVGHIAAGVSRYHLGELGTARPHLERAVALRDPQQHRAYAALYGPDLGVFALGYLAHLLWHRGDADRALERVDEAVAIARECAHPYSLAIALDYAAVLSQLLDDAAGARARAEEAIRVCAKHELTYYLDWARVVRGWALVSLGRAAPGLAEMRRGFTGLTATGAWLRRPYYLGLLAQAQVTTGDPSAARSTMVEAWASIDRCHERCWEPELHRIHAEVLLAGGAPTEEVAPFLNRAISTARAQGARSFELRAARGLARLGSARARSGDDFSAPLEHREGSARPMAVPGPEDAAAGALKPNR